MNTKLRGRVGRVYISWKVLERSCCSFSRFNIQHQLTQANYNLKSPTVYCSKNTFLVCFLQSRFCMRAFIHPLFKYPGKDKPYNKSWVAGTGIIKMISALQRTLLGMLSKEDSLFKSLSCVTISPKVLRQMFNSKGIKYLHDL